MPPHILLIGGHGKVAQHMTPLFLSRSWNVTSMIRNPDQKVTIEKLGQSQPGKLGVLVSSVEEISTNEQAKSIVDDVKPDWIVWSAGAGGKGGPSRTHAIDNIACKRFIHAAYTSPSVKKFLLVSYPGSRRNKPSWWTADQWASAEQVNNGALANYYKAKVASDEYLYSAFLKAKTEGGGREFAAIDLRPGRLTEEDDRTVELGKTRGSDSISRKTVAEVAVGLLENGYGGGYVDLTKGGEPWEAAVKRVVSEGVDAVEGENLSAIEAVFEKEPKM